MTRINAMVQSIGVLLLVFRVVIKARLWPLLRTRIRRGAGSKERGWLGGGPRRYGNRGSRGRGRSLGGMLRRQPHPLADARGPGQSRDREGAFGSRRQHLEVFAGDAEFPQHGVQGGPLEAE